MATQNITINVSINAAAAQAGAQQMQQVMAQIVTAAQGAASQSAGMFSKLFGAEFFAGLARSAVSSFMSAFNELLTGSTLYAARTEELGVALESVAKASGASIEILRQQEHAMKQLNITTQDTRQTLARFVAAQLDVTQSGALARTAQDLAVIAGVSTSEEINKLMIAIQTLQSRNLRSAGVFMTVDEILDRLAKTTHRARDSFSTLEKQQAVLSEVLSYGARVAGTYEAAMETAAKQMRSMERLAFEAQNAFGELFIGVFGASIKAASWLLEVMAKYPRLFLLMGTTVLTLSSSFVILNTRLYQSAIAFGTVMWQSVTRMLAALPMFNTQLALGSAQLNLFGVSAGTAAAGMSALQIALGGFLAIAGITMLFVSLGSILYNAATATEEFSKVSDSVIKVLTDENIVLNTQRQSMESYLKVINDINANKEGISLLGDLRTQTSDSEKLNEKITQIRTNVEHLTAERNVVKLQVEIADTPDERNNFRRQLEETSKSLDVQTGSLGKAQSQYEALQNSINNTKTRLEESVNAHSTTIDKVAELSTVEKEYKTTIEGLSPAVRAQADALMRNTNQYKDYAAAVRDAIDAERERNKQPQVTQLATALVGNVELANKRLEEARETEKRSLEDLTDLYARRQQIESRIAAVPSSVRQMSLVQVENKKSVDTQIGAYAKLRGQLTDVNVEISGINKSWKDNTSATSEARGISLETSRQLLKLRDELSRSNPEVMESTQAFFEAAKGNEKFSKEVKNGTFTLEFLEKQLVIAKKNMLDFAQETSKAEEATLDFAEAIAGIKVGHLAFEEVPELGIAKQVKIFGDEYKKFITNIPEYQRQGLLAAGPISENDPSVQRLLGQIGQPIFRSIRKLAKDSGIEIGKEAQGLDQLAASNPQRLAAALGATPEQIGESLELLRKAWPILSEVDSVRQTTAKNFRDDAKSERTELDRLSDSLDRARADLESFQNVGSKEWGMRIEIEEIERFRKDIESIVSLTREMGGNVKDVDFKRIQDPKQAQAYREELERQKKIFDQVKEVQDEIKNAELELQAARRTYLMDVVSAEVRAETNLLNLVRQRRDEEQQLTADLAVAVRERMDDEANAVKNVQRVQAQAFLDRMRSEQAAEADVTRAETEYRMSVGDFSFADNNQFIQEALEIANDPVIEAINLSGEATKTSGESVIGKLDEQTVNLYNGIVDLSNSVTGNLTGLGTDLKMTLDSGTNIVKTELDTHTNILSTMSGYLFEIVANTANSFGGGFGSFDVSSGDNLVDAIKKAIFSKESINEPDPYRARGPMVTTGRYAGERAVGKYQVMPGNLPQWSNMAFGRNVSVEEFLANPQMQEVLMNDQVVRMMRKYSNPADVISVWFTGRPAAQAMRETPRGDGYTSTANYINGALKAGGLSGGVRPGATGYAMTRMAAPTPAAGGKPVVQEKGFLDILADAGRAFLSSIESTVGRSGRLNVTPAFFAKGQSNEAASEMFKQLNEDELNKRERLLELTVANIEPLNKIRVANLALARAEERLEEVRKIQIDNVFELSNAEDELNRLRTDGVTILGVIQEAQLDRVGKEQDTQRELIRLAEEQNDRAVNSDRRRQAILSSIYAERWADEQELDNNIERLEVERTSALWDSTQMRSRVQKEFRLRELESQRDFYRSMVELDEEHSLRMKNSAMEVAQAWKQARNEMAEEEIDALTRIARARAKLEDVDTETEFVSKVRAKVLEDIAQVETYSDSVAGLFRDTFKVYTTDIDKWIDNTTEKMGNLGKIFNSFFKGVAHRIMGNIERGLLDAILPPTIAEQDAEARSKGEYGTQQTAEEQFRRQQMAANSEAMNVQIMSVAQAGNIMAQTMAATAQAMQNVAVAAQYAAQSLRAVPNQGGMTPPDLTGLNLPASMPSIPGLPSGISGILSGSGSNGSGINLPFGVSPFNPNAPIGGGLSGPWVDPSSVGPAPVLSTLTGQAARKSGFLNTLFGKGSPLEGLGSMFRQTNMGGSSNRGLLGLMQGFGKNAAGNAGGVGLLGNSGFAQQLPMMLAALGGNMGGGGFGSMLGMGGGLLAGIGLMSTPGIFAAGGALSFGGLGGALFSNPFTAAIGGALLVGAYFIGRNKQRRADETTRNQLTLDSKSQLRELVTQVSRGRLDGSEALGRAGEIRQAYLDQANQLKDRKAREHALLTVRELDYIINNELKPAIVAADARALVDDKIIATYNIGGIVDKRGIQMLGIGGLPDISGFGRIPGGFDARDNLVVRVSTGETILTPHQAAIVGYDNLRRANVRGYDSGARVGDVAPVVAAPSVSAANNRPIVVINVMSEREAVELANRIPDAIIAQKAANDAGVNPMVLPAAVAQALSY